MTDLGAPALDLPALTRFPALTPALIPTPTRSFLLSLLRSFLLSLRLVGRAA